MRRLMGVVLLFVSVVFTVFAEDTHLPYYNRFETSADTIGWQFSNAAGVTSKWYWGNAGYKSYGKSMYVSADNGLSAGYPEIAGGYYISLYRKFTVQTMKEYDLLFDCKVGGEVGKDGGVYDGLVVAWMPASKGVPTAGAGGVQFPAYAKQNIVQSDNGRKEYARNGWNNISCTVTAFENEYYLAFVWKANGTNASNMSVCIDNVQLASKRTRGDCAEKPLGLFRMQTRAVIQSRGMVMQKSII